MLCKTQVPVECVRQWSRLRSLHILLIPWYSQAEMKHKDIFRMSLWFNEEITLMLCNVSSLIFNQGHEI